MYQQVTWSTNPDEDGDGQTSTCFSGADCDDANPTTYFGATESCDAIDSNCNGDLVDTFTDFDKDKSPDCVDLDDDNDGDADTTDCDDTNKLISRFAAEVCDGVDNDCDTQVDEGSPDFDADAQADCVDLDDDNDGDPDTTDCNDFDKTISTKAVELCDGIDQNCDGVKDDGFPDFDADAVRDCVDLDDDGDSDPDTTDCDDANAAISRLALEVCDGVDNDCDGVVDDGYPDFDGDTVRDCMDPDDDNDADPDTSDCRPQDPTIHAGASETCDGVDQDCDGVPDDGLPTTPWYPDGDSDGYGAGTPTANCAQPPGTSATSGDCLDADPAAYPLATEACDLVDQDCDGDLIEGFADTDEDMLLDCLDVDDDNDDDADTVDCAPLDPLVFPSAVEHCDGKDENCDSEVDNDPENGITAYTDEDLDGFGDADAPVQVCTLGVGAVADNTDCDDGDGETHPGAEEAWYDDVDQACDGGSDFDQDGDGFDAGDNDCNDKDSAIYAGAPELPDGLDNDCDGAVEDDEVADTASDSDSEPNDDGDSSLEDTADPPKCGCGTSTPGGAWLAFVGAFGALYLSGRRPVRRATP